MVDNTPDQNATGEVPVTVTNPSAPSGATNGAGNASDAKSESLRDQATAKAMELAERGKEKASDAIDSLTALTDDIGAKLKEHLGDKYPAYLGDLTGKLAAFSSDLRSKDVEELASDAREFIRTRPAVAIGAAAAVGFMLARLVKVGSEAGKNDASPSEPTV